MKGSVKTAAALAVLSFALGGGMPSSAASQPSRLTQTLTAWIEQLKLPGPDTPRIAGATVASERYFPYLDDEVAGRSISVGDTSHGYLVGSRRLEESLALGVLAPHRERELRYGTEALVKTLEHAARALFDDTSTRLWVGNLGRLGGGDIEYSVSHNSGRDADIAFCYRNAAGEPVDPPDLVPLNRDGLSTKGMHFDAARTWTVVKALMQSPHADVQYLFIASPLREQLLLHAKRQRDDPKLIERAAAALRQPAGSAPHNDHLHLRIYCSRHDVGGGCFDTGVVHPWVVSHDSARRERIASALRHLAHRAPDQRKRALERLVLLDDREHGKQLVGRLDDDSGVVRQAAAYALAHLGGRDEVAALAKRFQLEPDPAVRIAVVQAVGSLGGEAAGTFLAQAIGTPRRGSAPLWSAIELASRVRSPAMWSLLGSASATLSEELMQAQAANLPSSLLGQGWWDEVDDHSVTLAALEAASRAERLEPVPALLAMLEDRRPAVRSIAARALRMTLNLSYWVDWERGSIEDLERGRRRWASAWQRSRGAPRDAWLLTGFSGEGYRVGKLVPKHAWELVRAIPMSDHVSFNAQRVLTRLFDHDPGSLGWPKNDACDHWLTWLDGRRKRYELDKPSGEVRRACDTPAL